MDPVVIGIFICLGFMGVVITIIRAILKARKLRRQQLEDTERDPFKPEY